MEWSTNFFMFNFNLKILFFEKNVFYVLMYLEFAVFSLALFVLSSVLKKLVRVLNLFSLLVGFILMPDDCMCLFGE